jgi:predicted PurR-regulated permease PerM
MLSAPPPVVTKWTARRVILATLVVCFVALVFWLLYHYYIVLFIVFVGFVLGTAIRPAVEWLARRKVPRALGVVLVYLLLLALLASFFRLIVPLLTEQVTTIAGKLPDYYATLHSSLQASHSTPIRRLAAQLPSQVPLAQPTLPKPSGQPLSAVGELLRYVALLGQAIFVGVSILVLAFYWTLDGERAMRSLLLRLPVGPRENARELIATIQSKVGAYVVGQTIVCLTVGLMALLAYAIMGLPYALVLGAVAAVFEALPVIGPILGAVPPALLALTLAPDKFIWVIVAVVIIQQAESNLIVPRVMDRSVGVNAIVTILAIAAFAGLFGLPGAVMAIPLAAVIQVLLDYFVLSADAPDLEQPEGRDRLSILRYQAQELVTDVRKQLRQREDQVEDDSDALEDMIETIATDLDSVLAETRQAESAA